MSEDREALREVLAALEDWSEANAEYRDARDKYTGYSPGYALHDEYQRCEDATDALAKALNEYIDKRIAAARTEAPDVRD